MHRLLQRQLKRHVDLPGSIPEDWQSFVDAVNETYHQTDADRILLERSLDLTSEELVEKNKQFGQQVAELERIKVELESTLAQTNTLYSTSHSLSTAKDKDEVLQVLAQPAIKAGAVIATLMYIDLNDAGEPEWIEIAASWHHVARDGPPIPVGSRLYLPEFPLASLWMASLDEPQLIADVAVDERLDGNLQDIVTKMDTRAMAIIPLSQAGRWVGIVSLHWDEPHVFSKQETEIYHALIGLAVPAVDGRRQFKQAQSRVRREQILREITSRIRSFTDPDAIVRAATRELGTALGRSTFVRLGSAEELSQMPATWTDDGDGRSVT
jgi:GAF domain-containing protein